MRKCDECASPVPLVSIDKILQTVMMKFCILLLLVLVVCSYAFRHVGVRSFGIVRQHAKSCRSLTMSTTEGGSTALLPDPSPGAPIVRKVDKSLNVAYMTVALTGEQTQRAFAQSCDLFNEEVQNRGYKAPGFRPGSKLPPAYLYQMFGEDRVKLLCGNLLSEEIQDECEKSGLMFVGRGRITQFNEAKFIAGKPHVLDIECDLWPEISYSGPNGYKGLKCTVVKNKGDDAKYEAVKKSIMERYKVLTDTPSGYAATMGDVVVANMNGFERNADGSKGQPLPAVAAGDKVEIVLEKGKFMEGLIEGLVGAKGGEVKQVSVKFPVRPSGAGAALSGTNCNVMINFSLFPFLHFHTCIRFHRYSLISTFFSFPLFISF